MVVAANASERDIVPRLVRADDYVVYGDAGYTGMQNRPEIQADAHLSAVDFRTNARNRYHSKSVAPGFDWDRYMEYQKSRVRCKVEYAFLVIKRLFGYRKVRYRGLAKNRTHALMLCFCTNAFLLARSSVREAC